MNPNSDPQTRLCFRWQTLALSLAAVAMAVGYVELAPEAHIGNSNRAGHISPDSSGGNCPVIEVSDLGDC